MVVVEVVLDHETHKGKEGLVRYAYKAEQHMFKKNLATTVIILEVPIKIHASLNN